MYATIQNKKIAYEVMGKGSPMLFVHGWGGSMNSMRELAKMASARYQAIIIDLPGFGSSDNPEKDWGVEEYANCMLAFIEELKLKDLTFFGHSFGGSLGIWLAVHHKKTIQRLILCCSAYKRTGKKSSAAVGMKALVSTYMPFLDASVTAVKPYLYKIFFRNSDLARFPHLESNYRKIVTHDLTPIISQVSCPTLIIWGRDDTYTPVSYAHELHEQINGSKIQIFDGKRHNLPLKFPDLVWGEIEDWK